MHGAGGADLARWGRQAMLAKTCRALLGLDGRGARPHTTLLPRQPCVLRRR